jgi:hypothetical protein
MKKADIRLTRRDLFRLGLTGTILSWLNPGCQRNSAPSSPTNPPTEPEPVYQLTDGLTLYDDFDGHGNFQAFDNQNLAEAGKISTRIWNIWTGWGTADVVENSSASNLLTVVNEDGQRVEYRSQGKNGEEIKRVYDADGKLIYAVPHIPGEPYHGSRKLFWLGAKEGRFETPDGPVRVQEGKVYGVAEITPAGGTGNALRLAGSLRSGAVSIEINNPAELEAADNKSFSADMMLSSSSTSRRLSAILDYHTTIPDQPPGKSWFAQIGIGTILSDDFYIIGQYGNVNAPYRFLQYLGSAVADTWYNLRMDMVTKKDDNSLNDNELRIDYYVNGALLLSSIPEDSDVILDPQRTGAGPSRILTVGTSQDNKSAVAYFDNVRAVYKNRIS